MSANIQSRLASELGKLDGKRIPGGCDYCEAYQTVAPIVNGVWDLTIHHEDSCPFFARVKEVQA